MTRRRKVHVRDSGGSRLFDGLWDDGSSVLRFESGGGFVSGSDVKKNNWVVCQGWTWELCNGR